MSSIAKTVLFLFFMGLITICGIQFTSSGMEVAEAQNFHEDVIEEIECSNFNPEVIAACVENAAGEGYMLSVNVISDANSDSQSASVIMKYNYTIKILGMNVEKTIRGFAR